MNFNKVSHLLLTTLNKKIRLLPLQHPTQSPTSISRPLAWPNGHSTCVSQFAQVKTTSLIVNLLNELFYPMNFAWLEHNCKNGSVTTHVSVSHSVLHISHDFILNMGSVLHFLLLLKLVSTFIKWQLFSHYFLVWKRLVVEVAYFGHECATQVGLLHSYPSIWLICEIKTYILKLLC